MAKKRSFAFWGGLGCLSLMLLCTGGGAAVFVGVFGAMKHSAPYRDALAKVRADPAAVAALGLPIEPGWLVSGSINEAGGGGGHAALAIPVHGPKDSGVLQVEALRVGGTWRFSTLNLVLGGSTPDINLLPAQPPPAPDAKGTEQKL